jgi:trehalose 6-phosphate phosphatase
MTAPPSVGRPALFLDFDGTLVDIAPDPSAVRVPSALVALIGRLACGLDGALAVVSGRPIAQLDRFLAPLELAAAGLHGLEQRFHPGGPIAPPPRSLALDWLRARLAASGIVRDGVMLEDKGATLALHYRAAPEMGAAVAAVLERAVAELSGLVLVHGKMVIEAKPPGTDKGSAVAGFLSVPPFAGRVPIFLGDDVTDEDAIRAVVSMGGIAVKVGEGPSLAPFRLADVGAVHRWLAGLADGLGAADTAAAGAGADLARREGRGPQSGEQ